MPSLDDHGPKAESFVWVHNEQVVSKRKGGRIDASARSHVMGDYLRKKNAARTRRLKDSSAIDRFMGRKSDDPDRIEACGTPSMAGTKTPIQQEQKFSRENAAKTIINDRNETRNGVDGSKTSRGKLFQVAEKSEGIAKPKSDEENDCSPNLQATVFDLERVPSPTTYLDSGAEEPFSAAAAPIGAWEHHLIHFFVECLTPDVYGANKESRESLMARQAHHMAFHDIIRDAGSLNALFAVSCANEEVRRALKPSFEPEYVGTAVKPSYYYRMKVIQHIRRTLEKMNDPKNDIDDRLIAIMLGLLGADWASGDSQAAQIHIKAICDLVKIKGGIHTLSPRWAEDVVIVDVSLALATMSAPILPLTWTQVDLPRESKLSMIPEKGSRLHSLGRRLMSTYCSTMLGPDLTAAIQKIQEATWVSEYRDHPLKDEARNRHWVSMAAPSVDHRLLSFHQYHSQLSDQPMQKAISVSLLLFTRSSLRNQSIEGDRYFPPLLAQLKSDLLWTDLQAFWSPFSDILLWVLAMGIHASVKARSAAQLKWFSRHFWKIVDFLRLKEWTEVQALLEELFYMESVHGEILRKLFIRTDLRSADENTLSISAT